MISKEIKLYVALFTFNLENSNSEITQFMIKDLIRSTLNNDTE